MKIKSNTRQRGNLEDFHSLPCLGLNRAVVCSERLCASLELDIKIIVLGVHIAKPQSRRSEACKETGSHSAASPNVAGKKDLKVATPVILALV